MISVEFPALNQWQKDCHNEILNGFGTGETFVIKSGRQRGKNFLINILLIEYCLKHPGTKQVVIEPVRSQCARVHKQLVDALEPTGLLKSSNATTLEIWFNCGSSITLISAEQKKAVRGLTCTGLMVFDEAAFIDDDIFQIALPLVNVHKCPKLYTSTPLFKDGHFWKMWSKTSPKYHRYDWRLDKYDMSDYITDEMIEDYRETYTPMNFLTEVIGDFCTEQSLVFGDFKKCIRRQPTDTVPVYGGLDFGAGTDNDETALVLMNKDFEEVKVCTFCKEEPAEQIDMLAEIINDNPTLEILMCEMNSIGEVYYSVLNKKVNNKMLLTKFWTSNESKREIIEDLIIAFKNRSLRILDNVKQNLQLSHFVVQKLKTGYTYNNDNPKIHDDLVMALALCYRGRKERLNQNLSFGFSSRK